MQKPTKTDAFGDHPFPAFHASNGGSSPPGDATVIPTETAEPSQEGRRAVTAAVTANCDHAPAPFSGSRSTHDQRTRESGSQDRGADTPADRRGQVEALRTVAALYVDPRGCYRDLPGVEIWDESRDARTYAGPHPVVAHPPCTRWCRLAGLVEARWGHKRGDDGGCFAAALAAVRRWGGVLEHPAYSDAWPVHRLPEPHRHGWQATTCGGWVCHVEQGRYGHPAKKATWLYARGVEPLPLRWGHEPDSLSSALVSWCGNRVRSGESRPRVGKREAAATPLEFRDALLALARTAVTRT